MTHSLHALETYNALGIDFVSLLEQIDASTPTGRMVFTVLDAIAELERSLIAERVRAGIRNAKAKGKRVGRPRVTVDAARIAAPACRGALLEHDLPQDRDRQGDNSPKGLLQAALRS